MGGQYEDCTTIAWPNLTQYHTLLVSSECTCTNQYTGPKSDPSVQPENEEENSGALPTYVLTAPLTGRAAEQSSSYNDFVSKHNCRMNEGLIYLGGVRTGLLGSNL